MINGKKKKKNRIMKSPVVAFSACHAKFADDVDDWDDLHLLGHAFTRWCEESMKAIVKGLNAGAGGQTRYIVAYDPLLVLLSQYLENSFSYELAQAFEDAGIVLKIASEARGGHFSTVLAYIQETLPNWTADCPKMEEFCRLDNNFFIVYTVEEAL